MIFYFSATGNSKAIAQALGKELRDKAVSITDVMEMPQHYDTIGDQSLGIVFPVYGWNPPRIVYKFLYHLFRCGLNTKYLYFVITCGDDIGMADKRLCKFLHRYNIEYGSIFSVIMPNTYVCLPGFDVDKDDIRRKKLAQVKTRIIDIARQVKSRCRTVSVTRGAVPQIKTSLLGWFFTRFLITDKHFHTTSDCTLCKKCIAVCPLHNISIMCEKDKIAWNGQCSGCLACYHHCPHKAIRFGLFSGNKGQYLLNKYKHELRATPKQTTSKID